MPSTRPWGARPELQLQWKLQGNEFREMPKKTPPVAHTTSHEVIPKEKKPKQNTDTAKEETERKPGREEMQSDAKVSALLEESPSGGDRLPRL